MDSFEELFTLQNIRGEISYETLEPLERLITSSSYDADAKCLIRQLERNVLCTQRQLQKALLVYKSFFPMKLWYCGILETCGCIFFTFWSMIFGTKPYSSLFNEYF